VTAPVGRLAPTPSGHLHLGNALAFAAAWLSARNAGGRLLLRIEDLDRGRAREEVAEGQRRDLAWLGIDWDAEVTPQSQRTYSLAGVPVYPCMCTRAVRLAGACGCRANAEMPLTKSGVWRFRTPAGEVAFIDRARGPQTFTPAEDPILMRDGEPAYPLAVVVDDARDGVTEVVRGGDLIDATATQIRLHEVLGLTPPSYLHVPVLLGEDGKKLSKSHGSTEIRALRAAGWTPLRVWETLLPFLGLPAGPLADARLDATKIPTGPFVVAA
jgi:glutamyl-tRNA synthetase